MDMENLIPSRIQNPDHAAHNKLLYQQCHPEPFYTPHNKNVFKMLEKKPTLE
jgi:hypothetical protein